MSEFQTRIRNNEGEKNETSLLNFPFLFIEGCCHNTSPCEWPPLGHGYT